MSPEEFSALGIIETYCLGLTTKEETILTENMAASFPEIKKEIDRALQIISAYSKEPVLQPRPHVKKNILTHIYKQQAAKKIEWVPMLNDIEKSFSLQPFVHANQLSFPAQPFENIFIQPLPSTTEIINFAIWARHGHDEEMHDDMTEYIAVMEGSCDMYFKGEKKSYTQGDIITIPPNIPHQARVSSSQPMFALVQRQMMF